MNSLHLPHPVCWSVCCRGGCCGESETLGQFGSAAGLDGTSVETSVKSESLRRALLSVDLTHIETWVGGKKRN